ncbi:hypothetical protein [Altererythrobacter fulvus]|uniref:hypothetical protein n=1 Tax=Caenibius fulvus TaxID=2126012 RepID=UPI003015F4BF
MAFQPFGMRFEAISYLAPPEAKAAIKARLKGWFDVTRAPRGWIVGPVICLWLSAFDRHGPMLFGFMSNRDGVTRISGRAGSNLNGMVFAVFLAVILPIIAIGLVSNRQASAALLFVLGFSFPFCGLALWSGHAFRRDAAPLVDFLDKTLSKGPAPQRREAPVSEYAGPYLPMTLQVDGEKLEGRATPEVIREAIDGIAAAGTGFAILDHADGSFIQAALEHPGFVIERGPGSGEYVAARRLSAPSEEEWTSPRHFSGAEVQAAFIAFLAGNSEPRGMQWG